MSKKIALDAGHGYNTPGKRTPKDIREWSLNSSVCNYIADCLKGYDVEVYRTDDVSGQTDVPVQDRSKHINNLHRDMSISIHHNALNGIWGSHGGVEVYSHPAKPDRDKHLAKQLADEIARLTGLRNRGAKCTLNGGDFHIIRETKSSIPSVLCEGGFMDSTTDEPVITSEKGQRAYAQAVTNVVISFLGLKKVEKPVVDISLKYKVNDIVTFIGGPVYVSSDATTAITTKDTSECKVTVVNNGKHPYHLISQDGKGVYGWVNADNISNVPKEPEPAITLKDIISMLKELTRDDPDKKVSLSEVVKKLQAMINSITIG